MSHRAYIKRNLEVLDFLINLDINKEIVVMDASECFLDQHYYLYTSKESFHGELTEDKKYFNFKDNRLPFLKIPLQFVDLEY